MKWSSCQLPTANRQCDVKSEREKKKLLKWIKWSFNSSYDCSHPLIFGFGKHVHVTRTRSFVLIVCRREPNVYKLNWNHFLAVAVHRRRTGIDIHSSFQQKNLTSDEPAHSRHIHAVDESIACRFNFSKRMRWCQIPFMWWKPKKKTLNKFDVPKSGEWILQTQMARVGVVQNQKWSDTVCVGWANQLMGACDVTQFLTWSSF